MDNIASIPLNEATVCASGQQNVSAAQTSTGTSTQTGQSTSIPSNNSQSVINGSSLIIESSVAGEAGTTIGGIGTPGFGVAGNDLRSPMMGFFSGPGEQTFVGNYVEGNQIKQNQIQQGRENYISNNSETSSTAYIEPGYADESKSATITTPKGDTLSISLNVEVTEDGVAVSGEESATTPSGQTLSKSVYAEEIDGYTYAGEDKSAYDPNTGKSAYTESSVSKSGDEVETSSYSEVTKSKGNKDVTLYEDQWTTAEKGEGTTSESDAGRYAIDTTTGQDANVYANKDSQKSFGSSSSQSSIGGYYYNPQTGEYVQNSSAA